MPECSLVQNLIPCFLTFCSTIEFNPFEFLIFYHSNLFAFYTCYAFIIHNNLSAGTQNVTGAYIIIMLVYRLLLTTRLHGKQSFQGGPMKMLEVTHL